MRSIVRYLRLSMLALFVIVGIIESNDSYATSQNGKISEGPVLQSHGSECPGGP
ncbi:MAG: hypothetical protein HY072_07600 [Deltaproteobacteria bacterium]|nr:hypothetical protein [Deltaproteobacteria bacterium]